MLLKSEISRISELQSEIMRSEKKGLERDALSETRRLEKYALIITGIRRCGKSTLLSQMISEKYPDSFFLNFDDPRLYGFDYNDFNKLDEIITSSGKRVLFFDELQSVEGWEKFIRQKLDEKYKVVITGSNASLLSRELGTKLTGRYISKELFPFSFNEFIRYRSIKKGERGMLEYLEYGGFPEYVKTKRHEILTTLFDDILIRDIIVRYGVRDIKSLQRLAQFLISNVGNSVTGSKLKQAIGISSTSTIMEYFSYLESAYLFYFVPRFSYSFKSQLINPRKIYTVDPGLITVNSSSLSDDNGHKLENAVFNYLRLSCKELFYFQKKGECDFIKIKKGKKPEAIQVCLELNHDNLERELTGLFEALNELKINNGIIVTLNQKDKFTDNNLTAHVVPAHEFMEKLHFSPEQ